MKLESCRQIFEKFSNAKFNENPSSVSQDIPCGRTDRRTDRHDDARNRFFAILLTRLTKAF